MLKRLHAYRLIRRLWGGWLLYIWVEANVVGVAFHHAAGDVSHWNRGVGVRGETERQRQRFGICGSSYGQHGGRI